MKSIHIILAALFIFLMNSCIQDDFIEDTVDPVIRITNSIDTIGFNDTYQFEYIYLNNIGEEEEILPTFSSNNPDVILITEEGLASGLETGAARIFISYESDEINVRDSIDVVVGESTVSSEQSTTGVIVTTTFYELEGDFEFKETNMGVNLSIAGNYKASSGLPGLYVYLSNNQNSIADAFEIGKVTVFNGAHEYDIENIGFEDYKFIVYFCKPFNIKVGEAIL